MSTVVLNRNVSLKRRTINLALIESALADTECHVFVTLSRDLDYITIETFKVPHWK